MNLKHVTIEATGRHGEIIPGKIHIVRAVPVPEDICLEPYSGGRPLCGLFPFVTVGGWPEDWEEILNEKVLPTDTVCKTCARLAKKYENQ